jgi:radical SAM-linked protein
MLAIVSDSLNSSPRAGENPGEERPTPVKFRLRFRKIGNLRLVSHHDLMHVVERMMRRAEIPFAVSQGFHPQPRMVFALSLALGVVGLSEVFELELTRPLEADELLRRLNAAAPAGLEFVSIAPVTGKGARVRRAIYRLPLSETPADLRDRIDRFLASPTSTVVRTRPTRRRLNVRPFVSELTLTDSPALHMALWITPTGAARPEEIASALGLAPLLEAGAVFERTNLELLDEVPEHERFVPDLAAAASDVSDAAEPEPSSETSTDGPKADERSRSSTPHPLIDSPMSYDS